MYLGACYACLTSGLTSYDASRHRGKRHTGQHHSAQTTDTLAKMRDTPERKHTEDAGIVEPRHTEPQEAPQLQRNQPHYLRVSTAPCNISGRQLPEPRCCLAALQGTCGQAQAPKPRSRLLLVDSGLHRCI